MKPFDKETYSTPAPVSTNAAALLMDVVPLIMDHLRAEMRRRQMPGLSVPQLRTLIFLYRHADASLSQVAEDVGLKLPSMSKMVDALVAHKLVTRRQSPQDRRCIRLKLSPSGLAELKRSRRSVERRLAETLSVLSPEQQAVVVSALKSLRPLFTGRQASVRRLRRI